MSSYRSSITHKDIRFTSSSRRRFVTFVKHPDSDHPIVIKRTDNVQTAKDNHRAVQRRFSGSLAYTLDFVGERLYQPDALSLGLSWIKPEPAFPVIPGRPANDGETEDEYIERVAHENYVTESTITRHGSME